MTTKGVINHIVLTVDLTTSLPSLILHFLLSIWLSNFTPFKTRIENLFTTVFITQVKGQQKWRSRIKDNFVSQSDGEQHYHLICCVCVCWSYDFVPYMKVQCFLFNNLVKSLPTPEKNICFFSSTSSTIFIYELKDAKEFSTSRGNIEKNDISEV